MWWFLSGYALAALAFYAYITVTAIEEPEALAGFGTRPGDRSLADRARTANLQDDRNARKAA